MGTDWDPEQVAAAVRRHLSTATFERRIRFERVELVGQDLQVVLGAAGDDDRLRAIRYSLALLPVGPWTGVVCASIDEWATEIAGDLDEVTSTRELDGAERRIEPDGLVLLRWWKGDDWSR